MTALKYRWYISDGGDIRLLGPGTGSKQAGLSLAIHSFVTDTAGQTSPDFPLLHWSEMQSGQESRKETVNLCQTE